MAEPKIRSLGLWWLRRDLRTEDSEALVGACRQADALLPVFCFDPRDFEPRRDAPEGLGVPKLGPPRCRFLLEGLSQLRRELGRLQRAAGSHGPLQPPLPPSPSSAAAVAVAPEAALLSEYSTSGGAGGGSLGDPSAAATAAAGPRTDREAQGPAAAEGPEPGEGPQAGLAADTALGCGGAAASECIDGGGEGGGGGGGLVVRFGQPEVVLPGLLDLVAAHNPELCHVSFHHHLDVLEESLAREEAVAAALREWAARRGVSVSIHTYWDRTLYHPDDLPYHLYDKASAAASKAAPKRPKQGATPASFRLPANADQSRYLSIPPVMTDFRKVTQSAATVRSCLPAPTSLPPLPPPFGAAGGATSAPAAGGSDPGALATSSVAATEEASYGSGPLPEPRAVQVDEPRQRSVEAWAGVGVEAVECGSLGEVPRTVGEVYDTVGARDALQRLEELVGLDYSQLLPPVDPDGPPATPDPRSAFPFHAGYDSAVRRLRYYVWGHPEGPHPSAGGQLAGAGELPGGGVQPPATSPPSLLYFTNTRAQAVGVDSSTKLSPFVALGCISPRRIHEEVERVRAAAAAAAGAGAAAAVAAGVDIGGEAAAAAVTAPQVDDSCGGGGGAAGWVPPPAECDWLAMHLCIRDFFILTVLKEGEAVLDERGIMGRPVGWRRDAEAFRRWARGRTGLPFVDANMRELAATGWMSNRGRQNVASLVTKDLGIDWRWGAELFECLLLDCDVAVNYCNWNYFAGIGNDPRNRHFKTVTQGIKYDEDAALAASWLPELAHLPPPLRHQPWTMTDEEARQYDFVLGRDYPAPMVDPANHVGQLTGTGKRKNKAKANARP